MIRFSDNVLICCILSSKVVNKNVVNLTLSTRGCRFHLTPGGGGYSIPPLEIKEGVVLGPMLLYTIWTYLEIDLTCKQLGKIFKKLAGFQDFKIVKYQDFNLTHRNCHNPLNF